MNLGVKTDIQLNGHVNSKIPFSFSKIDGLALTSLALQPSLIDCSIARGYRLSCILALQNVLQLGFIGCAACQHYRLFYRSGLKTVQLLYQRPALQIAVQLIIVPKPSTIDCSIAQFHRLAIQILLVPIAVDQSSFGK